MEAVCRDKGADFSVRRARELVSDLFVPQARIYWSDFLATVVVAYTAAWQFLNARPWSGMQAVWYLIAGVALYRASTFIHEIVHLRDGQMTAFKIGWNVLAGIPMLMPSFLYESHLTHHNVAHYGTVRDGEYLPLGRGGWRDIARFLAQIPLLPLLVFTRFAVLTPLSLLVPRSRAWILERASSLVINFRYRQAPRIARRSGWWAALEWACCARAWAIILIVLSGAAPWTRIPSIYALAMLSLGLNHLRTLIAHRYSSDGQPMDHLAQLGDSLNVAGSVLSAPLFPVGTRYHALHHLFPTIPYHNLGTAHRRLMTAFAPDSPYHGATVSSVWRALRAARQYVSSPGTNTRGSAAPHGSS